MNFPKTSERDTLSESLGGAERLDGFGSDVNRDSQERQSSPVLTSDERRRRIEDAAYRIAEARGLVPGADLDDWLAAEREVDGGIV